MATEWGGADGLAAAAVATEGPAVVAGAAAAGEAAAVTAALAVAGAPLPPAFFSLCIYFLAIFK